MNPNMTFQMVLPFECLKAKVTFKFSFFAALVHGVTFQRVLVNVRFAALPTLKLET